jgi:acyl carrier protein
LLLEYSTTMLTLTDTIQVLQDILRLGPRADGFTPRTALLGSIPEFDSMAVVSVLTAIEERFGIIVDDDEISAETFETVGSLHNFLLSKLGS